MIYIIIVVAMLFILGPIFMLRPSPRERRLQRIRAHAMAQKVIITPVAFSQDSRYKTLLEQNPHLVARDWFRYQLSADEGQPGPGIHGAWRQRKTRDNRMVWEPVDVLQKTPAAVAELVALWEETQASQYLSFEVEPRSVAIVWNERGDTEEVDAICAKLEQLLLMC